MAWPSQSPQIRLHCYSANHPKKKRTDSFFCREIELCQDLTPFMPLERRVSIKLTSKIEAVLVAMLLYYQVIIYGAAPCFIEVFLL